jgi:hypothetical protein
MLYASTISKCQWVGILIPCLGVTKKTYLDHWPASVASEIRATNRYAIRFFRTAFPVCEVTVAQVHSLKQSARCGRRCAISCSYLWFDDLPFAPNKFNNMYIYRFTDWWFQPPSKTWNSFLGITDVTPRVRRCPHVSVNQSRFTTEHLPWSKIGIWQDTINCQDTVGTNVCVAKAPSHMQRSAMPLALAHHCSLPYVAACGRLKPFSLPGIFLQHLQAQNCRWLSPDHLEDSP